MGAFSILEILKGHFLNPDVFHSLGHLKFLKERKLERDEFRQLYKRDISDGNIKKEKGLSEKK